MPGPEWPHLGFAGRFSLDIPGRSPGGGPRQPMVTAGVGERMQDCVTFRTTEMICGTECPTRSLLSCCRRPWSTRSVSERPPRPFGLPLATRSHAPHEGRDHPAQGLSNPVLGAGPSDGNEAPEDGAARRTMTRRRALKSRASVSEVREWPRLSWHGGPE
eukprot:5647465-Pyramimonas_sp.AAC.1